MSVPPLELQNRHRADSKDVADAPPDSSFRAWMKVEDRQDRPKEQGLFSLMDDEEDEEILFDGLSASLASGYCPPPLMSGAVAGVAEAARTTPISAEFELLFEKMASAMIVMNSSEETETTLYLDNPSSMFYGSRITIREFATAPKAFNIEIASSPRAIELIDAGKQGLLSSFQDGRFQFLVHRLETHIQNDDRPVFHRKEEGESGQKGERER